MEQLKPILKHYLWGGRKLAEQFGRDDGGDIISESWEVSVHPDGVSLTENGTFAEYLSKNPLAVSPSGGEFPVLIKYIDAADKLSVQVHPCDAYARKHENDNGKTEAWYIVSAEKGAGIYCGFKNDTSPEEFKRRLKEGTVEEILNFIPVKSGECYLIKAGTVHAIGAGCLILEVQESSNVTYRVYDYNRKDAAGNLRPLHVDKAMEVIDFSAYHGADICSDYTVLDGGKIRLLVSCRHFRCRELLLDGKYEEDRSLKPAFLAVNAVEGKGTICGKPFKKGDSFFIPCGENLSVSGKGKLILTDKPEVKLYAGIDIGGTFVKCGIVDGTGDILIKSSIKTGREREYTEIAKDIAAEIKRLAVRAGIKFEDIAAVGIGAPGTIDSATGNIVYSNNISWTDVPLGAELAKLLDKPVKITNDANAAALGEYRFGGGSRYNSIVFVTLGTGVGGGIVENGKLFEGNGSAGAEIGHQVIRIGGEQCTCGRRGCFEAYASATALIRMTKCAMEKNKDSVMWRLSGGLINVDGKTAFDAAKLGDTAAKRVVAKYIDYLAEGLANLANVFRPEIILIGGGVSKQGENLTKPLRKKISKLIYGVKDYAPVKIATATLGNDAGLLGAAAYAMTYYG